MGDTSVPLWAGIEACGCRVSFPGIKRSGSGAALTKRPPSKERVQLAVLLLPVGGFIARSKSEFDLYLYLYKLRILYTIAGGSCKTLVSTHQVTQHHTKRRGRQRCSHLYSERQGFISQVDEIQPRTAAALYKDGLHRIFHTFSTEHADRNLLIFLN